ncbi:sulfite exporter TauE/SafE family protein [Teredinibacter turnerae]|uniref:sulfite exporter TauE/SafE family protein n=1 Tax=Teredinibacter turnerae TaxID=2426 RepID=UPI0005F83BA3|nr:sulfite exporter TauE/SafE family protein [Teredinibacter turnerae]
MRLTPKLSQAALFALGLALAITCYFLFFGRFVVSAWQSPQWLIAPIMALGSFVAGATFLGGGAVAFPALTKILHTDPAVAKSFSLAIQSIGMTSASLYILLRVRNFPWHFIGIFLPPAFAGITLSLAVIEPFIDATDLRVMFTLFVLGFLAIYLWVYRDRKTHYVDLPPLSRLDVQLTLKAGFLGGILAGLLGSGADLIAFCLLALYFRLELKLATQCSVIVMASVSLVGVLLQGTVFQTLPAELTPLWLIAAPVVLVGAPVGAEFCRRIKPRNLLLFVCFIVFAEVISTLALVPLEPTKWWRYCAFAFVMGLLLTTLHRISKRKDHHSQHPAEPE